MDDHGHPMLSAVVVGKDDGTPGEGFYEEAARLNKDNLQNNPERMSREEKIEFWKKELQDVYETFSR
jgi:hypothetical protein